ncbi:MAG: hypothetical protein JNK49_13065 [Planctomycetes bacterium]|nr:hypothetical protein [Planctomycetota bacterium]
MTNHLGSRILAVAVLASLAVAQDGAPSGVKLDTSYTPGRGLTFDAGEAFSLTLLNYAQAGWQYGRMGDGEDTNDFDLTRARSALRGHVFRRSIQYFLQLEYTDRGTVLFDEADEVDGVADTGPVLDAWAQWNFLENGNDSIGLRVGLAKSYLGLEATGFATGFFFANRSTTSQAFSSQRNQGAWLHGRNLDGRLHWTAGAQNGDVSPLRQARPAQSANDDNELTFVGSVAYDVFGNLFGGDLREFWQQGNVNNDGKTRGTVGAGGMFGNNKPVEDEADVEATQLNLNTAWDFGCGFGVQAECFFRRDEPQGDTGLSSSGFYGQGMYVLPKLGSSDLRWGVGLRYSDLRGDEIDPTTLDGGTPLQNARIREVSAVVNAFYHGHSCKTQFEMTRQQLRIGGDSDWNNLFGVFFQVVF